MIPRWMLALLTAFLLVPSVGCGTSSDQVPDVAYCDPVASWPGSAQDWESRMLDLFNQARATGATCGANGYFEPTGALTMESALRCASRVHSMDMHDRQFFDHTNPDGLGPRDRFELAGWAGGGWGENIIAGYGSADAAFDGWMASDGHCANIMNPGFTQVGIGWYNGSSGYGDYGTAGFGN